MMPESRSDSAVLGGKKNIKFTYTEKLSLAAGTLGALSLAPGSADALVMQGTGGPVSVSANTDAAADWDIDGDGNRDFILWDFDSGPGDYLLLASKNTVRLSQFPQLAGPAPNGRGIVRTSSGTIRVAQLSNSVYVGPTLSQGLAFNGALTQFGTVFTARDTSSANAINGFGAGDNTIGLRFLIGTATHYAWATLNVDLVGKSMSVTDWFWESQADTAIHVGDRGSSDGGQTGVPEPGTAGLTLLGLGAAGLGAWRRRKAAEKAAA